MNHVVRSRFENSLTGASNLANFVVDIRMATWLEKQLISFYKKETEQESEDNKERNHITNDSAAA